MLKENKETITEEEQEEIIGKVLKENKVKPGQPIDYKYFKEIYESYKYKMSEQEFAEILGISYSNYFAIKNKRTKSKSIKRKIRKNK